jgi:hypothetical protein
LPELLQGLINQGEEISVSESKQPFALVSVTDYLVVSIRECL